MEFKMTHILIEMPSSSRLRDPKHEDISSSSHAGAQGDSKGRVEDIKSVAAISEATKFLSMCWPAPPSPPTCTYMYTQIWYRIYI